MLPTPNVFSDLVACCCCAETGRCPTCRKMEEGTHVCSGDQEVCFALLRSPSDGSTPLFCPEQPGYEKLCCTYAINSKNFKFNTVSICRVSSCLPPISKKPRLLIFRRAMYRRVWHEPPANVLSYFSAGLTGAQEVPVGGHGGGGHQLRLPRVCVGGSGRAQHLWQQVRAVPSGHSGKRLRYR